MNKIHTLEDIKLTTDIKTIVFDCFGTLLEIQQKRNPYKILQPFYLGKENKTYKEYVMSRRLSLELFEKEMWVALPDYIKNNFLKNLQEEVNSVVTYKDTLPFLKECREREIKTIICSNLAEPYGQEVKKLPVDHYVLSYEKGFVKPQPEIFALCHTLANCDKKNILFIGDNQKNDYEASTSYGFKGLLIERN